MKTLNVNQMENLNGGQSGTGITTNDLVCFGISAAFGLVTGGVGLIAAATCMVVDGITQDSGDNCALLCG